MRKAVRPFSLYLIIGSGSVAALLVSLGLPMLFPGWRWQHEPLHSTIEALGGLTAIAMAIVLLSSTQEQARKKFYPVAGGFLTMGLLEIFHALSTPGNGFVLLRSMASLVGGLGFALVWLRTSEHRRTNDVSILWLIAMGTFAFGIWTFGFPEQLPVLIRQGEFTPTAIAPKSIACMLFLAGALYFLLDYRSTRKSKDGMFAGLALMFGLAELMFTYSIMWDGPWWFWHWLRLMAYLLVLWYVGRGYLSTLSELQISLAQTQQAEESVRRSEQQLRDMLEERERLAQDLHDGAIQSIFTLGLSLERCQRLIPKHPKEAISKIGDAITDLKLVIRDLRSYISGIESDSEHERPLGEAIASLVDTMNHSAPFNFRMHVDPTAALQLTQEEATHVLYILKEAMSNCLRHAQAKSGSVSLQMQSKSVRLEVEDDGCGFDIDIDQNHGYGLRNMAERARRLGARFELASQKGKGTHIIFDIRKKESHVAASI
ncbi:MAG: hypothetical protein NPIRA02_35910 [Nitrospirales bacterium]|nr:MAG: hypothetical protein NPIRA02_35910 [Nitrospirales bacterium]